MRATKKYQQKNIAGKIFFISRHEIVFFSESFFLSPDFFSEIGNNLMRALDRKKHMLFLVMRGLNLMRALNREQKHSGLRVI